jgi:hypothetical protein
MATFTITTAKNVDEYTTKAGGDTYNINAGGTLTIDQDTRYGQNTTTTTGPMVALALGSTGGDLEIDGRNVRLINYDNGTGNVPAYGTVISQGGASGKLILVSSGLQTAPTAAGAAMPASGWIKIKQWNGTDYSSGALTGIGANSTGSSKQGCIDIVGDEAGTITGKRTGLIRIRGEWYDITTTSGSRTSQYPIPTFGDACYMAGVQVETSPGSGVYEWYPNMGSQTALLANIGTEAARGKVCWISSAGMVRFGYDGTNLTGGYLPASGCNIRIPSVWLNNCTTAARATTAVPNATLATRFEFSMAGARLIMDKVACNWYLNCAQANSISLTDCCISDTIVCSELASAATWTRVCVAPTQAQANSALTLTLGFAGGTISDSVFSRYTLAASGAYVMTITDCDGWTFSGCQWRMVAATRGNATTGTLNATRANNMTFTNNKVIGGRHYWTTSYNVTYTGHKYIDVPASTTPTANPMYAIDTGGGGCADFKVEGMTFDGLTLVQPYSGLFNVGLGSVRMKLRNIGTPSSPLDLGGNREDGVSWSRSTTTATVTKTAHGLKTGDIIYVIVSSDTAAITVATKTVASAPTSSTFTFTCLNAGAASGTLSYYPTMSAYAVALVANSAAKDVRVQRVYTTHTRTGPYTADNSAKNILYESLWGDYVHAPVTAELNVKLKNCALSHALTAQTNPVYGSHFADYFLADAPASTSGLNWTRTTTTATVTGGTGLRTGSRIVVTVSSDTAAIVLGVKTITQTGADTFTFTCLNAGATSGTLTYVPEVGRIALLANEPTVETASYVVTDAGTPLFTAVGTIYMPAINDQVTWETQDWIKCHQSFPIDEVVMAAGTLTNHDVYYAIDTGSGYSAFKNLSYPRAGGGGSSASTNVTMTSTTGVAEGDYVFGTNIAPLAKVVSITNSTTIVVDKANIGTVSGILRFNQLPNESVTPSSGFKLKIRVKTTTANTAAWSSLAIYTYVSQPNRENQYELDQYNLTLTGLPTGCDVVVLAANSTTILDQRDSLSGTSYTYTYSSAHYVDIGIINPGYVPFYIRGLSLGTADSSIPVALTADRNYQ